MRAVVVLIALAFVCGTVSASASAGESESESESEVLHPILPGLGARCLPQRRWNGRNWRISSIRYGGVCTIDSACPFGQDEPGYCAGIGVTCCKAVAPTAPAVSAAPAVSVAPEADYFAPGDAESVIAPAVPVAAAASTARPLLKAATPGAGCTAIKGSCIARSACTGSNTVQTGLCPGSTYCCVPNTPIPAGGIGARLASSADAVCASYKVSRAVYSQPKRQFGMSVKYSDCSSFVQSVFEHAGYGSIFGRSKAQTQAMRDVISARGGGYHKTGVKLGDIVMWAKGTTGHVGIITKICTANTFQFTGMGSKGCGPYPANGGCMTWEQMTAYGLGGSAGFKGYWTAQ